MAGTCEEYSFPFLPVCVPLKNFRPFLEPFDLNNGQIKVCAGALTGALTIGIKAVIDT